MTREAAAYEVGHHHEEVRVVTRPGYDVRGPGDADPGSAGPDVPRPGRPLRHDGAVPPTSPAPALPSRPGRRSRAARLAVLAATAALLAGCGPGPVGTGSPAPENDVPAPASPAAGPALDVLETLPVKGRAPRTGYTREEFGQAWTDDVAVTWGHNGCDTRNDILRRDLVAVTFKPGTRDCVVLAGTFPDPYGGRAIAFRRGAATSTAVQIDHVVALSDAWQSGAQQWDAETRRDFANDPLVLLAADGGLNAAKRDSDAASWLPPYRPFRCEYVARQVAIKARYRLWVKPAEKAAMARGLARCPGQGLPGDADATRRTPAADRVNTDRTGTDPTGTAPAASDAADERYADCTAARAAGAAPVRLGDAGYGRHLDRDGDGVGCE